MEAVAVAVEGTRAGDLDADEVLANHVERVTRFASMLSATPSDAEDLAQEALVRVLRNRAKYDASRGSVDAWLWQIVMSTARDARRGEFRRRWLVAKLTRTMGPTTSIEALALDRIRDSEIRSAVRRLQGREQLMLALRYGAGFSVGEIARHMGLTPDATSKAIHRALSRLHAVLGGAKGGSSTD